MIPLPIKILCVIHLLALLALTAALSMLFSTHGTMRPIIDEVHSAYPALAAVHYQAGFAVFVSTALGLVVLLIALHLTSLIALWNLQSWSIYLFTAIGMISLIVNRSFLVGAFWAISMAVVWFYRDFYFHPAIRTLPGDEDPPPTGPPTLTDRPPSRAINELIFK
jgi:hypothetical protein